MLDQVELGLGGVVAQHAVVVAGITLHRVFVLLQVLWEGMKRVRERRRREERQRERETERGRERGREKKKKLLQMADSWRGTTDSLLLKERTNEQINSQSQPCCLTSRPLPLQDNCLDCALCLSECLYQSANRPGEAWEARKSQGPRRRAGITSATLQKRRVCGPRRRKAALIPFTQQKPPVSEKETPNICLFHAWDAKY